MLCSGGLNATDTRDSCQGDSGGPLVMSNNGAFIQRGITSFGGINETCGEAGVPGVYAKVSRYKSFIQEQVSDVTFVVPGENTGSTANKCTGAVLDSQFDFEIACLIINGNAYQTSFIMAGRNVPQFM